MWRSVRRSSRLNEKQNYRGHGGIISVPSVVKGLDLMPGKVAKIGTFSEWVGMFNDWRKEIGLERDEIASFKFDTLYGAIETEEIQRSEERRVGKECRLTCR